ncbi:ABC transporter permease [Microbacterium halotolerans]|uniref:ABC transporter permease n=1 Tax=Microbacterium halotolerans TaxID=246613 RepID=UPI000E6A953E|nr:ABC transporter permease [Microbacterium halotolerans]
MTLRLGGRGWRATALVARQLAVLVFSLFVASIVIFASLEILPGDQASILAGTDATPAQLEQIRSELGLDRPAIIRYLDWVAQAMRGDLGSSLIDHRDIGQEIAEKMAVTAPLGLAALAIGIIVALPLGMLAAVGTNRWYGQAISGASQLGIAIPTFVVGIVVVRVFAVDLGLLPAQGFPADRWGSPVDAARSLVLPALTLGIAHGAVLIRFVRSAALDVLEQEWVRTARSHGWRLPLILVRQGLRNTALPLLTVVALEIAGLLTGAVIVEQVFSLPGIGQLVLTGVGNRDFSAVQGTLLFLTALIMTMTLALDLINRLVDPRLAVER